MDIWTRREIRSAEEWIDRYVLIEDAEITSMDGVMEDGLKVAGFKEVNYQELQDVFQLYMYRLTTEDLIKKGLIPQDKMPKGDLISEEVMMDPIQRAIYNRITNLTIMEQAIAEFVEVRVPGAVQLTRLDMKSKATLDPRLLASDLPKVLKRLVMDEWAKEGGKGRPPIFEVEYPMPNGPNGEGLSAEQERKVVQILESYKVPTSIVIDGEEILGKNARPPKVSLKTGNMPVMVDVQRENLVRRLIFLKSLPLDTVEYDEASGVVPPKYAKLVENIASEKGCGHLIFCDYDECHGYIQDALVHMAKIPADRIAFLTGSVDPEDRQQIADDFNGQSEDRYHPISKALLSRAFKPKYDVLIGNSAMQEGLNLQTNTCSIHHMNIPWTPGELQQRNGRGVRQGNKLKLVKVRTYLGRGTLDVKRMDTIQGKATWQELLLAGAAAGSISLEGDWAELIIQETSASPEDAERRIAKARADKAVRDRWRLGSTIRRDFAALVQAYAIARNAPPGPAKQAQLAIADRNMRTLAANFAKFGPELPANLLREARVRTVWLDPMEPLWFVSGEKVQLLTKEGIPSKKVEVVQLPEHLGMIQLRVYGETNTTYAVLPREGQFPYRYLHAAGPLTRVPESISWSVDEEWRTMILPGLLRTESSPQELYSYTAAHGHMSPAFVTKERVEAFWRAWISAKQKSAFYPAALSRAVDPDVNTGQKVYDRPGALPLVSRKDPEAGVVLLINVGGYQPLYNAAQALQSLVDNYRLLAPGDADDTELFRKAAKGGMIFKAYGASYRNPPATPLTKEERAAFPDILPGVPVNGLVPDKMSSKEARDAYTPLVRYAFTDWFLDNSGLPQSMITIT